MVAIGEQHVGPESLEHLAGQVEKHRPFLSIRRPLGPARSRGQERHTYAVDSQVKDSTRRPPLSSARNRLAESPSDVSTSWNEVSSSWSSIPGLSTLQSIPRATSSSSSSFVHTLAAGGVQVAVVRRRGDTWETGQSGK